MDTDRISVAFTTYQRTDLLFKAVEPFLSDERVREIVIVDDCSSEEIRQTIAWKYLGTDKVEFLVNEVNLDCYRNKKRAIENCTSDWVLILDSDNEFSREFIDVIFSQRPWNPSWAYAPEFAEPHFNFKHLSGVAISRNNAGAYLDKCSTMLNAMNYFVRREAFLSCWDGSIDPVTSDSLFHNYNFLKAGGSVYVTPGLRYTHRIHDGSHYRQNVSRTPKGFHEDTLNKLRNL